MTFWQKPCWYCGREIKTIGLDRANNEIGYKIDNLIPCCATCNKAKRDMTQSGFILMCVLVARRNGMFAGHDDYGRLRG